MSQEIVKFNVDTISMNYSSDVKEELQDECYSDNKACVSETTITDAVNIIKTELDQYIKDDSTRKYETLSVDYIKTDLPLSEVIDRESDNVKIEDGICPADIEIKLCNELPVCSHCHEVYQDYCTQCRVLVHVLNERPYHNRYDRIRELPKCMLEARESIGELGIFSLKVIPENVRFGPFTGLNSTELSLRIKGGRFVVSDDKSEHLNWMQYINPARNNCEQNLFPMQYEDKLYYCSTRRIQKGEELLVYFGKEYDNNLLKNMEMDFVPIVRKDVENVFACIFCCLGFRSKEYLAEHKAVCHNAINGVFSVEEVVQCPFCKIYLETKEYFEHHKDYCCDANIRYCVLLSPVIHELKVERRSSEAREAKRWKRRIFKCTQCKFRTMYSADFRHHTNKHYEVKVYKCGICNRKYKTKESLKAHVQRNHVIDEERGIQKYATPHAKQLNASNYKYTECEYKTSRKSNLQGHIATIHLKHKDYKCTECEFETNYKSNLKKHIGAIHQKHKAYKCTECAHTTNYKSDLKNHIAAIHLKQRDYKCTECAHTTNYKSDLKKHIAAIHLKQKDYKCTECDFMAYRKSNLDNHIKAKHLKQNDYKCMECEFKTNYKENLDNHINRKHLKEIYYNCTECEFKTNYRSSLKIHKNAKHLKENDYKCMECEFKTSYKANLRIHIKGKHLKQNNYKCTDCEYTTIYKWNLEKHVKAKHLKQKDYKCTECEYKTYNKSNLTGHIKAKHKI